MSLSPFYSHDKSIYIDGHFTGASEIVPDHTLVRIVVLALCAWETIINRLTVLEITEPCLFYSI